MKFKEDPAHAIVAAVTQGESAVETADRQETAEIHAVQVCVVLAVIMPYLGLSVVVLVVVLLICIFYTG